MLRINRRIAFTLAEVLITLGIIGVVAALTLPTLIQNYRKSQVENKLKSSVSIIQNAIRMSEAKYGDVDEWQLCEESGLECTKHIWNDYLAPEMHVIKTCAPSSSECWTSTKSLTGVKGHLANASSTLSVILKNGSALYMWTGSMEYENGAHMQLYIDIDGPLRGKNMMGADVFGFHIYFRPVDITKKGLFVISQGAETETLENASRGCSTKSSGVYAGICCGALIQKNGWKIPDNYPVKF